MITQKLSIKNIMDSTFYLLLSTFKKKICILFFFDYNRPIPMVMVVRKSLSLIFIKMNKKIVLPVKGMHCNSCEMIIESTTKKFSNVQDVKANRTK